MKIHEYQAKELFRAEGIPIPAGQVVMTAQAAYDAARGYGTPVVVKAQVLVGGRGKAGGVKLARNADEARTHASSILGMSIKGLRVDRVLITQAVDIATEIYLAVIVDRAGQCPVIIASASGGVDIEDVARTNPELIQRVRIDPLYGILAFQSRSLASRLHKNPAVVTQIARIIEKLYVVFDRSDASLAEINPLVVTPDDKVIAIDAKVIVDDNALYRQPAIAAMRDLAAEDPGEVESRKLGLSFVKLDGSVGCIVNGAGLAMATMDLVKTYGGEPANFLDIGGSSNPDKMVAALNIIQRDPHVRSIFINIFGGITRCDDVARGLVMALQRMDTVPKIVVRLTGTNETEAKTILKDTHLAMASTMDEGVKMAVEMAR